MFYDHPIKDRQARLDWLLLIGVVGLMAMGVAYIFSATMANEALSNQP